MPKFFNTNHAFRDIQLFEPINGVTCPNAYGSCIIKSDVDDIIFIFSGSFINNALNVYGIINTL